MLLSSLSKEQKEEFKDILETLGESLDITQTQYDNLVRSYNAVGEFLQQDPNFEGLKPLITPQGSLRLGTIIQPINPDDDLDVDLIFRLADKKEEWTQKDLKSKVGNRLKSSERYAKMLKKEEGRRNWTLLYRDKSDNPKEKYHMDILPAVADADYPEKVKRLFSENYTATTVDQIAIRITDNQSDNYSKSNRIEDWMKSNPDGYALWFANRCKGMYGRKVLTEEIVPMAKYQKDKTVLQRIVQILKRHRDMMFRFESEDKPISIIITTLAARAYNGESNLLEGLVNVVKTMERHITTNRRGQDEITNPVNPEENFADKWLDYPKRKKNFYKWLKALKEDVREILGGANRIKINETMSRVFGRDMVATASKLLVERRKTALATGASLLTSSGKVLAETTGMKMNMSNTFYGEEGIFS